MLPAARLPLAASHAASAVLAHLPPSAVSGAPLFPRFPQFVGHFSSPSVFMIGNLNKNILIKSRGSWNWAF
jgi:hypothetical protein